MKRTALILLWLASAWLLWSGHYSEEVLILSLGIVSCLFVAWLVFRMERASRESRPILESGLGTIVRLGFYLPWLALQTVLANLQVARLILSPKPAISPRLLRLRAAQRTEFGQVVYANSITLTPGTVTLDLRGGELLVHALTEDSAAALRSGEMNRRVKAIEGEG